MQEKSQAILESVDGFITTQAKKVMRWHLLAEREELNNLEVDELIQRTRIKLWKTLEKGPILRPFSYVRRIIYSEFIDMQRQQKYVLPLPDDENEGGYHVLSMVADPVDEVIQRMEICSLLQRLVQMTIDLPSRQQMAMISFLWNQVEDTELLHAILAMYGLDRKVVEWPTERVEKKNLLASLSVARQKMAKKRYLDKIGKELL